MRGLFSPSRRRVVQIFALVRIEAIGGTTWLVALPDCVQLVSYIVDLAIVCGWVIGRAPADRLAAHCCGLFRFKFHSSEVW